MLADTWYATSVLGDMCVPLDDLMRAHLPRWLFRLAERVPGLRSLLFFWLGRSYDLLVTTGTRSWLLLLLEALFGKSERRVVLLEFIGQSSLAGPKAWAYPVLIRFVRGPAFRKSVAKAQVLTDWEVESYARLYAVPAQRFQFIPWPGRRDGEELPVMAQAGSPPMVLSTGRAACDWETLFQAAEDGNWALTVVCGKDDVERVKSLNRAGRAKVLAEISPAEHDALVEAATVYVLSLKETLRSSGQIRLRYANRVGTPVVASGIRGLSGYAIDGETALVVAPQDHAALRRAVDRLLHEPELRETLRSRAFERVCGWTWEDYAASIRELVAGAPGG